MQVRLTLIAGILAIFLPQLMKAQVEGFEKGPSVEGITEYTLTKNGLKVLLFPEPSKPTITVNITYLVGSRHEGYGETGMAHLLEHMVFKGTPKHPDIPAELTKHGARPNGTTWLDRTNYFETFAANDENLNWALDLEADRMVNSYIAKKDLESEMTVVRNEFESGENDPTGILMERVISTAYLWHNYGKSTIGARSDIENVPIERLQAFYKKYYQPDNAVLVVAGQIDVNKTLGLIKKYFEPIPKPDRSVNKLYPTYTLDPVQDGERSVVLRRTGDVQAVMAAYHICPGAHPDYAALEMLNSILTDNPGGILYKDLVETKKANDVYAFSFALKEPGIMIFGATVPVDSSLANVKNILLKRLDQVPGMTFKQEDLDRQKQKALKYWDMTFNNVERVGTNLSEYIAQGDWRLTFIARDQIKNVTLDDLKRVASMYYKSSNRTIGEFIPDKNPDRVDVPGPIDVMAVVKDYKGNEKVAEGEAFDPSPANIDKRTSVVKSKSSNFEIALLPKQTRGNVVVANITLRMGDLSSLKNKATIGDFTASLLNKGTKTMTKQQISDEFDRLKSRVSFGGGATSCNVRIETTKENLKPTLALVADVLKNASFPESEFEIYQNQEISNIESQKSEPTSLAGIEFGRALSSYPKGDPRYVPTLDESIAMAKAVTLDEVKKFHRDFYGSSDATASVVGDFTKAEIEKMMLETFGNWKAKMPYKRIANNYQPTKAQEKVINTPDKANALYLAGFRVEMKDNDPDYPAMLLANYMMGGGFLNSRLATRIRQKEGLSYGVGSQFSASPLDKNGGFTVYAISAPENSEKVNKCVKEEIEKVNKEGFTAEELEAAKSGFLQSRQVSRAQDASLAGTLNNNLYLNRTMQFDEKIDEAIKALTPAQVNAAFNKYISPDKLLVVRAGDFEKDKEKKP
ncbi:MAG: insulinase family protein [Saprospiraceae bacterium]|nr:insulinase family protein [Saprospiraceae bacterium]